MNSVKQLVISAAVLAGTAAVLLGCTVQPVADTRSTSTQEAGSTAPPVDYTSAENWLSAPVTITQPVDVFYLYPTSFQRAASDAPVIATIDDPGMRQRAQAAFARQATAFETSANIFAPYYRQADAQYTLALPLEEQDKVVGGIPAGDALAAFQYYLDHYNEGRPFILAGHSQGSNVLLYLLADYMKEHPDVYKRMIAAYVIGYSVTPSYLAANPHLKFAEGPDDTGVIVSYNTEAPTIGGTNPVVQPHSLAINPISWTRDETVAPATQNPGSIALMKTGYPVTGADGKPALVKDFADARVDTGRGVVICSTCPVDELAPGNALFPKGVFHTFDYPFYYFSIRENAAERTSSFLAKQP
jgi:hypothetical protein